MMNGHGNGTIRLLVANKKETDVKKVHFFD